MYRFFLIFFLATNAIADEAEIPAFESDPIKYSSKNWIRNSTGQKVWVKDELLVGDFKDEKMKFWVHITGPNYHQCSISGEAKKLSKSTYQFKEDACSLLIKVSKNRVVLSDDANTCHENHCGNNAYFHTTEFLKTKK